MRHNNYGEIATGWPIAGVGNHGFYFHAVGRFVSDGVGWVQLKILNDRMRPTHKVQVARFCIKKIITARSVDLGNPHENFCIAIIGG